MLTVDERARSMLIAQYGRGTMHPTTEMQIRKYNLSALPSDTAAALRALTTAINQLDEARAVALEELSYTQLFNCIAAAVSPYGGGTGVNVSVRKFREAYAALSIKPAAPSGEES